MSTPKARLKSYQPGERRNHSTVRVGDILYIWGGFQTNFPEVHNGHEKKIEPSVVEMHHLPTGRWDQKPTAGNPPLGIHSYASAAIGNEIFYFGGDCNHQGCYHNSLHSFNVKTLSWKELSPTTSHHGPMMKRDAGMVAMRIDGEDYLVVIGGWGLSYNSTPGQPEAEYRGLDQVTDLQHCNEIHYYKLSSGEWISPLVKGDRPPPISHFTLASLSMESAVLFGGLNMTEWSNRLYFIKFSKGSLDISEIVPKNPSLWPQKRYAHSGVLINTIAFPEHLAMPKENYKSGSYLLVLNLPGAVTDRFYHSLSVWEVRPGTYQIIEFGGGGQSSNTAVYKLRCIHNDWLIEAIQPDFDLREKKSRRQSEESSQLVKKESLERELEEEIRRERTTIRLRKDLQEREEQLRMTEESFREVLHLVKDEKESAQFEYLRPQLGTVLVSAVYAISVSKALLKPLVIELQHCVDLRTSAQADCLKFVRAPLKSPYEFSLIDGGSFNVGRRYGSIERDQFSLIAIVAEMSDEESSSPSESGGSEEGGDHGTSNQEVIQEVVTKTTSIEGIVGLEEATAETCSFSDQSISIPKTEINQSDILYTGMMYHERRDTGYWITMYTAVKDLDALLQHVENNYPNAKRDGANAFKFNQCPNGIMKVTLGTPREAGWTIHPHQEPMELHQSVMDSMQSPMVSTIQVSVYAVPGVAKVPLHCPIKLTGINPSITIFINRRPPPSSIGSTSTYNNASSHSMRENEESMNRQDIADATIRECAKTTRELLLVLGLTTLLNRLVERRLINDNRRRKILDERSTNQRISNFISLVRALVRNHDDAFRLFVEIIQEEDSLISDRLAQTLIDTYTRLSSQ